MYPLSPRPAEPSYSTNQQEQPIPPNLVEQIEAGAFVEMGDLLPSRLGLDDGAKSIQKHHLITNITEWLQSFAVYVSVIAKK